MLKKVLFFSAILALTQASELTREGRWNHYIAYTGAEPYGQEVFTDAEISAVFDPELDIIIYVHGHGGSAHNELEQLFKFAILSQEEQVNLVFVDWATVASRPYVTASAAVPGVGVGLGQFISNILLASESITLNQIHLIGFDLGAHVCGWAAREHGINTLAKITGLNPTGLYWGTGSGHLTSDDAKVVEIIYTDTFQNGMATPSGTINMYINRGRNQPGCANHLCSHNRALEIMTASISNANLRGSWCSNGITDVNRDTCTGPAIRVGTLDLQKPVSGFFRANTGRVYPF